MQLKKMVLLIYFGLFLINQTVCASSNQQVTDDQDIAKVLKENGVQGTMIIFSLDQQIKYIHNSKRANERLVPASTFKIPNSIIAIEEKVLKDQYEIIKWDGQKRELNDWNKDHNLKSAFKYSAIWFYQELAKKIGKEKYLQYLDKLDYGNHLLGEDVTTFWLEGGGNLKITPYEQIAFLRKIYQKQLPFSERTYDILKDIMLEEVGQNYKIYSKTGAATKNWIGHGWYVGYVTTNDQAWFFVTNILINGQKDLPKRKATTITVLKKKGII